MSARSGRSAEPCGGEMRSTTASMISGTPWPVFAEQRSADSRSSRRVFSSSSRISSGRACGRSTLLKTGMTSISWSIASVALATVCAWMPCAASISSSAPSQACSDFSTS